MTSIALRLVALVVTALSLGLSFAHLLEAPPRLRAWPRELWRDATVFHGQYALFGSIGGPIDVAAVVLTVLAAVFAVRRNEAALPAILSAALFAAALVIWLIVVNRANAAMATWRPGPLPANFDAVRRRWEAGHAVMAGLKLAGFVALGLWAIRPAGDGRS